MNTRSRFNPLVLFASLAVASIPAHATDIVDFSSVIADIGSVSTAVIALLVAFKGAQYVWRAVRSG